MTKDINFGPRCAKHFEKGEPNETNMSLDLKISLVLQAPGLPKITGLGTKSYHIRFNVAEIYNLRAMSNGQARRQRTKPMIIDYLASRSIAQTVPNALDRACKDHMGARRAHLDEVAERRSIRRGLAFRAQLEHSAARNDHSNLGVAEAMEKALRAAFCFEGARSAYCIARHPVARALPLATYQCCHLHRFHCSIVLVHSPDKCTEASERRQSAW